MNKEGLSLRSIAGLTGLCDRTVRRIISAFKRTGEVNMKPHWPPKEDYPQVRLQAEGAFNVQWIQDINKTESRVGAGGWEYRLSANCALQAAK